MPISIIIHIANEDPIVAEIEQLPGPTDTSITVQNPRRRDGKEIHYLQRDVTTVIWPIDKLNFIEIAPSEEAEDILTPWRE